MCLFANLLVAWLYNGKQIHEKFVLIEFAIYFSKSVDARTHKDDCSLHYIRFLAH